MKTQVETNAPLPAEKPIRRPTKWPLEIRHGDVTIKIYRTPTIVRGEKYDAFTLSYFAGGKRQRRQFADFGKAKQEAERIAEQKAQGALGAAALSGTARIALEEALGLLAKADGTGNATASRLVEIVRDYASAQTCLPAGSTLAEAARFFAQRHPTNMTRKTVSEVVAEFIADRKSAGCSAIHLRDLGVRLGQFSAAFNLPIQAVSAPLVQQWVYALKREYDGKPASNRTKENMLR